MRRFPPPPLREHSQRDADVTLSIGTGCLVVAIRRPVSAWSGIQFSASPGTRGSRPRRCATCRTVLLRVRPPHPYLAS